MKNYIVFVNDHSGSMSSINRAAIADYNASITAVKDAATAEMLDTVVSVIGFGYDDSGRRSPVRREVQISNPHVLKPIVKWECIGMTPLYDGIMEGIKLLESLPDINDPEVSPLFIISTDGGENSSFTTVSELREKINQLTNTGRWTFTARVPKGQSRQVETVGIPAGNILQYGTTNEGMAQAQAATTTALRSFTASRAAGTKSSSSFYTDASKVDITALKDISKDVSLYVVPVTDNGVEIRPFILRHRMEYLKGAAFYQLTKTESRVSHTKQVLVRDRASGKIFAGAEARKMIGLPTDRNARLHPGDHKNFDLFIQSESVNRKLVGGTGVVYWKAIGVPFTEADLAYLLPKAAAPVAAPAPVVLPQVPVSNKPTKSPIPTTPQFQFYETREEARRAAAGFGVPQSQILRNPSAIKGRQWSIPTRLIPQREVIA